MHGSNMQHDEDSKDAARFRWLMNLGADDVYWENILRVDLEDFDSITDAIDKIMQASK